MSGLPWAKFFWSDYAADPALKLCSFAAQGLWMRMLCIAAEHEPVGFIAVNGNGLDIDGIARMTGGDSNEVSALLIELDRNGVFSRDRRGWIYSRRMINDAKKRRNAHERGKKGGNPSLLKQRENQDTLKLEDKSEDNIGDKPQSPEARVQSKKALPKKALPDGWEPNRFSAGTKCEAIERRWSTDEFRTQLEGFKAHHTKLGSRFVDWQAAWSTWVLNSEKFKREDSRAQPKPGSYLETVVRDLAKEERR